MIIIDFLLSKFFRILSKIRLIFHQVININGLLDFLELDIHHLTTNNKHSLEPLQVIVVVLIKICKLVSSPKTRGTLRVRSLILKTFSLLAMSRVMTALLYRLKVRFMNGWAHFEMGIIDINSSLFILATIAVTDSFKVF
jgi:hypothetical protein